MASPSHKVTALIDKPPAYEPVIPLEDGVLTRKSVLWTTAMQVYQVYVVPRCVSASSWVVRLTGRQVSSGQILQLRSPAASETGRVAQACLHSQRQSYAACEIRAGRS